MLKTSLLLSQGACILLDRNENCRSLVRTQGQPSEGLLREPLGSRRSSWGSADWCTFTHIYTASAGGPSQSLHPHHLPLLDNASGALAARPLQHPWVCAHEAGEETLGLTGTILFHHSHAVLGNPRGRGVVPAGPFGKTLTSHRKRLFVLSCM